MSFMKIQRGKWKETPYLGHLQATLAQKPDVNWQAESLLPGGTYRRSRVRFESPVRVYETDNDIAEQSIKPATYGSGPWFHYHAHFEAAYGWDYATKVLYLAVSLRVN